MFSAKMNSRIAGLALAGTVLAAPAAAMAGVVVKSTGPSSGKYPVGAKVADTATITLKAGDVITVLTSRGTKVMKGAGTFKVGERPKATRTRFSALTRKRAASRSRTGASRRAPPTAAAAAAAAVSNPSLWYVDVTKPGKVCLNEFDAVRFWRPDNTDIVTYDLSSDAGSVAITFDAKDRVAPLDPALMSIAPGNTYTISGPGEGASKVEVTFVMLEGDYARADQLAEALIAAGCTTQLNQMAERLGA